MLAFLVFVLSAVAGSKYGALAFDSGTMRHGWAYDYDSVEQASVRAQADCGAGCEVVLVFADECAAYVRGSGTAYGWAKGASAGMNAQVKPYLEALEEYEVAYGEAVEAADHQRWVTFAEYWDAQLGLAPGRIVVKGRPAGTRVFYRPVHPDGAPFSWKKEILPGQDTGLAATPATYIVETVATGGAYRQYIVVVGAGATATLTASP
jgi:hypothetical protein